MISLETFFKKKEMKGRDCPTRRVKLFTRDFEKMYFVELNFDILMNIVNTISSIYSFDAFSRIQVKNLEFLDLWSLGCYSYKSI